MHPTSSERQLPPAAPEAPATPSPEAASVRLAGLADIPAIARLAHVARAESGDEPEAVARARRLLLTHVAFEHGALWIERLPGEPAPVRAVAAIPGQGGMPSRPVLEQILRRFATPSTPTSPLSVADEDLLTALENVDCAWIISEISRAQTSDAANPELLATAFAWTQTRSWAHRDRIAVLAGSEAGRVAALSIGFTRFAASPSTESWWLGVKDAGVRRTPAPPAGAGTGTGTGTAA